IGCKHRHHDLRLRIRIAGDVAGKPTHVLHDDGLPPLRRGSANSAADLDLQTTNCADIRSDDETVAAQAIETRPEELRKPVGEDGVDRGHQSDVVEALASLI